MAAEFLPYDVISASRERDQNKQASRQLQLFQLGHGVLVRPQLQRRRLGSRRQWQDEPGEGDQHGVEHCRL